jgi:hypothetical protein
MALGTVKASGGLQTQLVSDRSSDITAQSLSGLGDAVNRLAQTGLGYLNSRTDIEKVYDQRAQASQGLQLDTQFLEYQQARAQEFTEFSRERSANPAGLTKDYDAALAQREAEFLKTVPPRFQEEMKAKLAQDRALRVGSAFTSELTLLDTADTNNLNKGLTTIGSGLKGGGVSLEDAQASWEEMVLKSGLPDADKASFIDKGKQTLQGLEFGTIVEQTAAGYGAVSDGTTGDDVVAAGLLPQDRGVLNVIAQNEAPNYNVWNGGSTFEGYEDHPAATSAAPGESTAAGRYQFILGTWRAASASYEKTYGVKVPNFSPEWQDRVALHWAEHQFNAHYKASTFREILASGDPQRMLIIRDVLGKPRSANPNDLEWQGLGYMSDAQFIETLTGQKGFAGGGTGAATGPNVWTDPRFADLSLDQKQSFANAAAAAAEQQRQSMATELKLQRDSFLDQAYNAGYANQPGVLEALQQSSNWDAEAQARYNSGQEVFRKSENEVAGVGASLAAGAPLARSDIGAFGRWFGPESFAGVAEGNEAAMNKMRWAVGQARIFPEGSADAFSSALGNPQTAPAALEFLASAMAGDTSILKRSGFDQDTIAQVQLYKNLAEREASGDKAFEAYSQAVDAEQRTGKTPTQLSTEASKLFMEKFPSASTLVNDVFDGWFTRQPNTTMNPAVEGQLMLDANSAYLDGYRIYGNADAAEAYMQSSLENLWGVTQTRSVRSSWGPGDFGGQTDKPVLMRYPPEKYYPAIDGDYGFLYNSISEFATANGASPNGAVLIPDATTDKEVREGKLPTYKVLGTGEFGEAIVLPGRFGGDTLEQTAKEAVTSDAAATNSLQYVDDFAQELVDLNAALEKEKQLPTSMEKVEELILKIDATEKKRQASIAAAVEQGYMTPEAVGADPVIYVGNLATEFQSRAEGNEALLRRISGLANGGDPTDAVVMVIAKELRVPKSLAKLVAIELQGAQE